MLPFHKYFEPERVQEKDEKYDPFLFQIPNFLLTGTPNLIPGGGAEVIPIQNSSWFNNIGFTPPTTTYPSFGLPVYSASGFDVLSILTRVANRKNPLIHLGPVDLSASFVVVDVRRHDNPVVYCSPSFCQLTGYDEHDVLGRNCRFLQSPHGGLQPTHSPPKAYMRKSLSAHKECQTTIINYKRNGAPFINLVTVIPISGGVAAKPHEADQIVYHVGFQVDLTQQPDAILEKLKHGSYIHLPPALTSDLPKHQLPTRPPFSNDLRSLLASPPFLASTIVVPPPEKTDPNHILSLLLLDALPDCILVVSLKGSFLYVAPAVRRILGYDPADLIGTSIATLCHPADVVPLMRELKQSSAPPIDSVSLAPRTVDLLFRAQPKSGSYVWVECRGRLHAEPGKGRKAVILSARTRAVPRLLWGAVARAGGLARPPDREFWAVVSAKGVFVAVGEGARAVLGWAPTELVGRSIAELVLVRAGDAWGAVEGLLVRAAIRDGDAASVVRARMRRPQGAPADVRVVLYPVRGRVLTAVSSAAPMVCQVQLAVPGLPVAPVTRALGADVFEELETARASSWQYELQQLRFANERLRDEIQALEAGPGVRGGKRSWEAV